MNSLLSIPGFIMKFLSDLLCQLCKAKTSVGSTKAKGIGQSGSNFLSILSNEWYVVQIEFIVAEAMKV
jgi:hypothetical protein